MQGLCTGTGTFGIILSILVEKIVEYCARCLLNAPCDLGKRAAHLCFPSRNCRRVILNNNSYWSNVCVRYSDKLEDSAAGDVARQLDILNAIFAGCKFRGWRHILLKNTKMLLPTFAILQYVWTACVNAYSRSSVLLFSVCLFFYFFLMFKLRIS